MIAARAIVSDDVDNIRAQTCRAWIADPGIDVIISTGGPASPERDVTPRSGGNSLFEKKM